MSERSVSVGELALTNCDGLLDTWMSRVIFREALSKHIHMQKDMRVNGLRLSCVGVDLFSLSRGLPPRLLVPVGC